MKKKTEESTYTCNRLISRWPLVSVEAVVLEYNKITADPLQTARIVACILDVPKTTEIDYILHTVLQLLSHRLQSA